MESKNIKPIVNGEYKLFEINKGKEVKVAMLATILPNSLMIHDEIRIGHNLDVYYVNPKTNEIIDHEILYLQA